MEDAEVLSCFLLTTNISIEDALKRYEAERKERTKAITLKACRRSHIICGKDRELTQQWYDQL